ncbi:MAG: spike base protein, RCAP_Rcc01079 family [Caulobacteraceae bacterium]
MRRFSVIAAALAGLAASFWIAGVGQASVVQIDPRQPDPSYGKSEALTVGAAVGTTIGVYATPIRAILIVCTGAGNVSLTLADGSTVALTGLPVGIYVLPLQVTEVNSSGTTATASYWDLG